MTKNGFALIFNNKNFDLELHKSARFGSSHDVQLLRTAFMMYNFRIKDVMEPTLQDIKNEMEKLLDENLENALCLVVVVMSHGEENDFVYAKDTIYNMKQVITGSKVFSKLGHLPKIIITQACKERNTAAVQNIEENTSYFDVRNILKLDSTFEGFTSVRYSNGSPFIIAFCEILMTQGHKFCFSEISAEVIKKFENDREQRPTIRVNRFEDVCPGKLALQSFSCKALTDFVIN